MTTDLRGPRREAGAEGGNRLNDGLRYPGPDAPYYVSTGDEIAIFETCHARRLPLMLKGPT
jgi:hypothetical protein